LDGLSSALKEEPNLDRVIHRKLSKLTQKKGRKKQKQKIGMLLLVVLFFGICLLGYGYD